MKLQFRNPWFVAALAFFAGLGGYAVRSARANGIPTANTLTYAGLLEDASGAPLTGSHTVELKMWDAGSAGTELCSVAESAQTLVDGRFQVALPNACVAAVHANPTTFVEIIVDSQSLGRSPNGAVPYAVEADKAANADALGGQPSNAYLLSTDAAQTYLSQTSASATYETQAAANATFLPKTGTATDSSALGGVAASGYQHATSANCGTGFVRTIAADGTTTCGTGNSGTVTSVGASSPLSSSGGTAPTITLNGTVPVANGGNRFGGMFMSQYTGAVVCPGSNPSCAPGSKPNVLTGGCTCPSGFSQRLVNQTYDGTYNVSNCEYFCYQ